MPERVDADLQDSALLWADALTDEERAVFWPMVALLLVSPDVDEDELVDVGARPTYANRRRMQIAEGLLEDARELGLVTMRTPTVRGGAVTWYGHVIDRTPERLSHRVSATDEQRRRLRLVLLRSTRLPRREPAYHREPYHRDPGA